ncbi:hypothetical protein HNO89_003897 [Sporosarcina luteola]|nr:hypothetical protein [Sporosarcina luteola]
MIRKGRFAIWNGKEYALVSYQRQYYLQTEDVSEERNGFERMSGKEHVLLRPISVKELQDAYEIIPYTMIKGYRFAVEGVNQANGKVALVTNNPFVKGKVDVRPYGKYEYIIELPEDQVDFLEDRLPILGFDNQTTYKRST